MIVEIIKIQIHIDSAYSLKEKRKIIKSAIGRLKSRFNVSVSEVDLNDLWHSSQIGISIVSNEKKHLDRTCSLVLNFLEEDSRFLIQDVDRETIYF